MAEDFVHLLKVNTKPTMHSGLAEQMANSEK